MRNLLDRLKPEYKAKLKKVEDKYPTTIQGIYSDLSKTNFYTELTIGMAVTMCSHLDLTLTHILDLFDDN